MSESGYYRWLRNRGKRKARELLSVKIREILEQHPDNDNYGVRRMRLALEQIGIRAGQSTVYRAMTDMGIIHGKRKPRGITKATTEAQDRENLIKRKFHSDKRFEVLLSDITMIQCMDGKLYVSAVLDCYNGEIVSVVTDDNMKKELCIRTVEELKQRYGKRALTGTIFHSDRGSQYTSEGFRKALSDVGMIQSLSGTGHCYDNARMESFFATLKKEKLYRIPTHRLKREEVKRIIFRYIHIYYNRIRVATFNPYGLPPVAYREWAQTQAELEQAA